MPGAQAEYLRVAMADASLFSMPGGMKKELGLMMCDILPTGFSVAMNAWRLADEDRGLPGTGSEGEGKRGFCVVVGCGPVSWILHCRLFWSSSPVSFFSRLFSENRTSSAGSSSFGYVMSADKSRSDCVR